MQASGQCLVNLVDIYKALPTQDRDGGPQYEQVPSIMGVACSVQARDAEEVVDEQNRITMVQIYHVFFNTDPGVRARDKMTYVDARGNERTLFARATRDEAGRGDIFVVRAIERI